MKVSNWFLLTLLVFLILFIIFLNWFRFENLSSGDWIYYFPDAIKSINPFSIWGYGISGLGSNKISLLWLEGYFGSTIKIADFLPWIVYERLFWFWPFLILSITSSYLLCKKITNDKIFPLISSLIYTTNTYILMVVGGGQMGVALAFAFTPFVILTFLKLFWFRNYSLRNSFLAGFLFSIQVMFDIRLAYITTILLLILLIYSYIVKKEKGSFLAMNNLFYGLLIPLIITFLFHLYWILPLIIYKNNPLNQDGNIFSSYESIKFFSFAKLDNAISLLHPNWPENIFGKVNFFKTQFLLLPILAFSSLLFLKIRNKSLILFFVFIGLLGAFLSKGSNEPLGQIYNLFSDFLPGFKMFRDPTKWYLLTSLSYAILIPYSLTKITEIRNLKKFKWFKTFIFILFCFLWFGLIHQIVIIRNGTYKSHSIPREYSKFAEELSNDKSFYRTLWIPQIHRYGFSSEYHPAINYLEISKKENLDFFKRKENLQFLQDLSIKYLVVPIDNDKELFLTDGVYDENKRNEVVRRIRKLNGLKEVKNYGDLKVFEVYNYKPHLYLTNRNKVNFKKMSTTKYKISIDNAKKGDTLIYVDNYDPNWILKLNKKKINSKPYSGSINSFKLERDGYIEGELMYEPQKYVYLGLLGPGSILCIASYLLVKKR